jgi:hypothetical protein
MYSVNRPLGDLHVHGTIILKMNFTIFANNAHTEFHKNVANGLVADTRSQTDGREIRICRSSCLIRPEPTQTGFCPSVPVAPSHN